MIYTIHQFIIKLDTGIVWDKLAHSTINCFKGNFFLSFIKGFFGMGANRQFWIDQITNFAKF